ncbi:DUF1592 domain-containing protein [Neorhodopirellula pilleata]|uniref:Planctomycete cytochrome C n=1 Tax=Neorhodopirellula pilleata TaxID=2714738 RepID=A0A5C6A1A0_9BACT|nr:DUF1592 domain-containing protein [Neorhodopirellula pilleata]TWT93090.1 hypothetical protein Pla100_44070 [Neorhodopirellula pilleata]
MKIMFRILSAGFIVGTCVIWLASFANAVTPENVRTDAQASPASPSVSIPASSMAFVRANCMDCHDGDSGEGDFDVNALPGDLSDAESIEQWVRVFDRVQNGEMPPPEDAVVDAKELQKFLPPTSQAINQAERLARSQDGRVQGRRLTNQQLQNTLNDLLSIDVPLASLMPAEQRTHGFVHLAEAQAMSHFQLQSHLRVVDAALDAAFDRAMLPDQDWSIDYGPEKIANKRPKQRNRDPEMRDGLAVVWSHGLIFYGRISNSEVDQSGWYDIEVTASAVKSPKDHGVWCSVRSGECSSGAPLMTWIGGFEATKEPKTMKYRAWIPENHMLEIRPSDVTLAKARTEGGQVGFGECENQDVPGVAMHSLKMTRVFPGGDVATVRKRLFGGASMQWDKNTKRSYPNLDDVDDEAAAIALQSQLSQFAQYAFRRPTSPDLLQPYVEFAVDLYRNLRGNDDTDAQDKTPRGQAYYEALRSGYRAILCSPRFLYLTEPSGADGRLDDWAIASRLSYLITNTMPDKALLVAARQGSLDDPAELRRQTTRLLATPDGQQFVANFAAHWLDLIDIDFTEPDRRLFKDFDVGVQDAMLQETHRFLNKLLAENRPVSEMINADYTFMNSRLARYYDIGDELSGVSANQLDDQMRLVKLKKDAQRGGLLTHGSILKVTANGNDTSPVLRGIWVCERILGMEIPAPPANVPAVEPDIRGATTIRELLAKHEADPSCASCHKSFDPPGFALENFDAGGKWRQQYQQLVAGKYKRGGKVDPSYTMVDGREFETFDEFRDLIAGDPAILARNLASQLLVYSSGATISFSDRAILDKMVAQTRKDQHGFRSILDQVIASDGFLKK